MGHAPIRTPWQAPPEEGQAIEVAEGVLWLRLPLPMKLDHVNVYALDDGDSWTIIDTGLNSRRGRAIWEAALSGPLKGKPVARVLVTHHHPDHIGMAGWFQAEHGCELLTTRTAWLMARMLTLDEQQTPTPEALAYYRSAGMDKDIYDKRASERPFNFADVVAPLPLGFTRLQEGSTLRAAGRDWQVRIGNGHAPEHATLWSLDDHLLLGGDQLLASISPNIGIYPTEPGADPLAEWLESCERLSTHAQDDHLVLPGHKLPFTGLPARMVQLIENHHSALERLEKFLETPRLASACFPVLFKREIGAGEYGLALVEAMAHLNHLYLAGRISRIMDDDGAFQWQQGG